MGSGFDDFLGSVIALKVYQNRSVIILTHCPLNPDTAKRFDHQVCFDHNVRQLFKFFVGESAEHIIYLLSFSKGIANTKTQPCIILAVEQQLNVF